ncbi:hypothetical protein CDL15_Pgr024800 [Punica granatum]|uniref:Uncharacterized protein n=1 Tax=Punica granatum TaxID=22663 RepID=A0A218WJQ2_PUNGR|nr:hypothetical protein CDL15_Pgr024800 [Punica granatum]
MARMCRKRRCVEESARRKECLRLRKARRVLEFEQDAEGGELSSIESWLPRGMAGGAVIVSVDLIVALGRDAPVIFECGRGAVVLWVSRLSGP